MAMPTPQNAPACGSSSSSPIQPQHSRISPASNAPALVPMPYCGSGDPAPCGTPAERHLQAPAQQCATGTPCTTSLPIKHPVHSQAVIRHTEHHIFHPASPPPRLGPRSEAPHRHWSQPSCNWPGAIIAGRHKAGDKPPSSPQPFLMGQRELSPRGKKEHLWLGRDASGAAMHGIQHGKPTGTLSSGMIPLHCSALQPGFWPTLLPSIPSAVRQGCLAQGEQGGS